MEIDIPGYGLLRVNHLVMDYNGTLAIDGSLADGVKASLNRLAAHIKLHAITADTFGKATKGLEGVDCTLQILTGLDHGAAKRDFVKSLGASETVSIGNGRNDRQMLETARIGIAVILEEGVATETLIAADIVCPSILSALFLLENPLRLKATLRS